MRVVYVNGRIIRRFTMYDHVVRQAFPNINSCDNIGISPLGPFQCLVY
jgi:hypothetical protein